MISLMPVFQSQDGRSANRWSREGQLIAPLLQRHQQQQQQQGQGDADSQTPPRVHGRPSSQKIVEKLNSRKREAYDQQVLFNSVRHG